MSVHDFANEFTGPILSKATIKEIELLLIHQSQLLDCISLSHITLRLNKRGNTSRKAEYARYARHIMPEFVYGY